jgi:RNA polymerase sigma factor (sigma-70 family)
VSILEKSFAGHTDQELWNEIRCGGEWAFTQLFDRYHRNLYNYGCKLTTHSGVVEDGVQDVFIDIWRLRHNLTPEVNSVKFYLYRSLRRRIHLLQSKLPPTEQLSTQQNDGSYSPIPDIEAIFIEQEFGIIRTARIKKLLAELPERQIEALTLRYFEEFSIQEISVIMRVTEKSVRNFLYKALGSLRQHRELLTAYSLIPCVLLFS